MRELVLLSVAFEKEEKRRVVWRREFRRVEAKQVHDCDVRRVVRDAPLRDQTLRKHAAKPTTTCPDE